MFPTIDLGVVSVLTAIGGFLLAVWNFICRVFEWCQNKFILFVEGTRLGRALAEFALFALIFSAYLYGVQALLDFIVSYVWDSVVPQGLSNAFQFINNVFPFSDILSLITYGFILWQARTTILMVHRQYTFVISWLSRLVHFGKL